MDIEHYHITPDEVQGVFTIRKITDFEEDDYCYLTVDLDDEEKVIIYNYPPEDGQHIRTLDLPCRAFFSGGHLETSDIPQH